MSWHIVHWDEEAVREALKRGRYDDVSLTGWGRLDDLVALSYELGVVEELEQLSADLKGESGPIPCSPSLPALTVRRSRVLPRV